MSEGPRPRRAFHNRADEEGVQTAAAPHWNGGGSETDLRSEPPLPRRTAGTVVPYLLGLLTAAIGSAVGGMLLEGSDLGVVICALVGAAIVILSYFLPNGPLRGLSKYRWSMIASVAAALLVPVTVVAIRNDQGIGYTLAIAAATSISCAVLLIAAFEVDVVSAIYCCAGLLFGVAGLLLGFSFLFDGSLLVGVWFLLLGVAGLLLGFSFLFDGSLLLGVVGLLWGVLGLLWGFSSLFDGSLLVGVAGLLVGVAGLLWGFSFLFDCSLLVGVAGLLLGVAGLLWGFSFLFDGSLLLGVAGLLACVGFLLVGVGVLIVGSLLVGVGYLLLGVAVLLLGVAVLIDGSLLLGVAVLLLGVADLLTAVTFGAAGEGKPSWISYWFSSKD